MKYKSRTLYIIFLCGTIYLWIQNNSLRTKLKELENYTSTTDTIISKRTYEQEKEKPFDKELKPNKLIIYPPEKVGKFSHIQHICNSNNPVVSFRLEQRKLSFTSIGQDTLYQRKFFPLNLNLYQYDYQGGKLTYKKKSFIKRLSHYTELRIRPLNRFYDLSGGLSFKTNKFNYKLGINFSYYPMLSSKIRKDLEIVFTYNF